MGVIASASCVTQGQSIIVHYTFCMSTWLHDSQNIRQSLINVSQEESFWMIVVFNFTLNRMIEWFPNQKKKNKQKTTKKWKQICLRKLWGNLLFVGYFVSYFRTIFPEFPKINKSPHRMDSFYKSKMTDNVIESVNLPYKRF